MNKEVDVKRCILMTVLAAGLAISACTPARFAKVTESYANSTADVSKAWNSAMELYASEEMALRNRQLFDRHLVPVFAPSCERGTVVESPDGARLRACGLAARNEELASPGDVWREGKAAGEILKAFSEYAKGLQELTSAESRKEIDTATDTIAAGLAGALTAALQPELAAAAAAAVKLGGFAYGEAFDAKQYHKLQKAVEQGQKSLPVLAKVLGHAFEDVASARIAAAGGLGRRYAAAARPGSPGYADNFAKAADQAAVVESIQRANARAALDEMLKAHAALAKALEEDKGDTLAVLKAMGEFASRADAMRKAIEGLNRRSGV